MRVEVLIYPKKAKGNVTVVGSYRDSKIDRDVYLVSGGKKVATYLEEKDRVFNHTFEAGLPFRFTYETDDPKEVAVLDFWKNHPLIQTEGHDNYNLIREEFELVEKSEQVRVEYEELIAKITVLSKINNMTLKKMYDLCFALGGDPRDMEPKEIYLYLVGSELNGLALENYEYTNDFFSIRDHEKEAEVYANKAVAYEIVKMEGSVYKIGGRNAGTDIDGVVSMILSDKELFENYIKPEVDKKDQVVEDEKVVSVKLSIPEEPKAPAPTPRRGRAPKN